MTGVNFCNPDYTTWTDRDGYPCENYLKDQFCTSDGKNGEQWNLGHVYILVRKVFPVYENKRTFKISI
jgi:hypothetical protein